MNTNNQKKSVPERPFFEVFVDGAGMRPDGSGSGYAFVNVTTGKQRIKSVHNLTNNQAEFRGLLYALLNLPAGSEAEIFSDSALVVNQFNGNWAVNDPKLATLLKQAREIIQKNDLSVTLRWLRRDQNLAGKLLDSTSLM
jgi:ribonuclease HI